MLRKDQRKSLRPTADAAEVARFNALAEEWWKPSGAFKVVHEFNAARLSYLSEQLPALHGRRRTSDAPLAGLRLLDAGCGAGLVAEPMARLGAEVIGIDASERNVSVARLHAEQSGLDIDYRHALPEDLHSDESTFDIVLSLEVVEHVSDVSAFFTAVGRLVKPGGVLVIGTLNRTPQSYIKAIIGAEYVLGWLPRGTHAWTKFVTPAEVVRHLAPIDFDEIDLKGVSLNPFGFRWSVGSDTSVNYLHVHRRRPATE